MKYQQLEHQEAGWKWYYLVKKHKEGANITRYLDSSEEQAATALLLAIEHEPIKVNEWIVSHMALTLENKLKQAIRARRKRYFNAEHEHTRKKSIDLDFVVWEKLAQKANELDATLSDTIEYLISETARSSKFDKKVDVLDALKQDLNNLLSEE